MAANVVEVVVKSDNQTQAGFDAAKAGADQVAASMDTLAAASDRVTQANVRYAQTTGQLLDAQLQLAEVEGREGATEAEIAAAKDKVTAATLKQADAQITLLNAEAKQETAAAAAADASVAGSEKAATAAKAQADATKAAGDAAVVSGAKSDEAGGLMAGAGAKVKMAALGISVGMGLAVKSAVDFQASTTKLVTSAGESAGQLGMLQQGILGISAQTATSSEELSKGLYMISSAGITGAGGLNVLKAAAEGAKSEGADLGEVTNALTSGLNAYGMNTKTAAAATASSKSMMDQMLQTVSQGKMTFQELAGSLSSVLPIAAANKISYAQVGGALATMTSMGMSAQQGTQDLAFSIRSLANPTSVATKEMAAFGINSTTVASQLGSKGLSGTISELSSAVLAKMGPSGTVIVNAMNQSKAAAADAQTMLGKLPASVQGIAKAYLDGSITSKQWTADLKGMPPLTANLAKEFAGTADKANSFNDLLKGGSPAAQTYAAAMSKMLGGATGLNVGLMLTGTHAKTFADNVAAISASAHSASGEVSGFADVQKTTAFQLAQLKDSLQAAGIELGLVLLPAVSAILKPLASFAAFLAQNHAAALAFAIVVGGVLAGAIGTKAVKAITDFKDAVHQVGDGISWLVGKIAGIGGAQADAAAASDAAAAEQEAAAGEVAAANDEAAAESSGSWVASAARAVAAGAVWVAQSVAKVAVVVAQNVAGAAVAAGAWVAGMASQLASGVAWVAEAIAKVAIVVGANIAGAVATAAAWVIANGVMLLGIGLVVAAVALAVYEIVTHWKSIVHGVEEAWDAVYHAVSVAVSTVVDFVKSHWMLLLGILLGPIALAVALIATYWKQISSFTEGLYHDVTSTVSKLGSDVLGFFERMASDVTGAERKMISDVIADVKGWISEFLSTVTSGLTNIVSFFTALPGRILRGLGNMASLLVGVGQDIIRGLVNGIDSMGSFLANSILNLIPSPIRSIVSTALGILSPSKVFHGYGQNIVQGLVNGIEGGQPQLRSTMTRMAGNVAGMGSGGLALAGAGATVTHQVQLTIDNSSGDQFIRWLRQSIRTKGGNVQAVLGAG